MFDKDMVIRSLEACASKNCAGCMERGDMVDAGCIRRLMRNAAEIMKEQDRRMEAVSQRLKEASLIVNELELEIESQLERDCAPYVNAPGVAEPRNVG